MKRRGGPLTVGLLFIAACFAQTAAPYQEGIRLLRNREWKAAAAELERAVRLDPNHAEARLALGFALREAGRPERAMAEFAAAVKLNPALEDARIALALAYRQAGKLEEAIAQCEAALKRNPKSAEANNWLGVFRLQKSRFNEAAADFRKAIELKPDFVRAWNNLGSALAQAGDVEASVGAFRKAVALDGADPQLRMNLGIALRGKGDADAALEEFQAVLRSDPDNADVHQQLALTLKQQGNLGAAAQAFEKVLTLDPERREAYYNLGTVLRQQAAAVRRGNPPAPIAPSIEAVLREAAGSLSRGDRKAARTVLEKAALDAPSSAAVWNLLGFAQGQERDLTAAVASLRRAVELNPDMPEAHYNLGVALWYGGDRARALESLERSILLNPAAAEVHAFLGMARREAGEPDRARQALQRAIALAPNLPAPYVDLGLLFLNSGRIAKGLGQIEAALNLPAPEGPIPDPDTVIGELRRVLSTAPDAAEGRNVLGLLLGKQGADPKQVMAEFREAIRLRPDYAEAHNNLGLVLTQAGDNEGGIAEFRQALLHAPGSANALANLGAALVASQPSEAVRLLEKAVAIQPAYVRAQYNLALAYAQSPAHGPDKATEQFRKVIGLEPGFAAAHFEFGKILFRKNSLADAIMHFREAVKLDPKLGAARYQLGLALTRAGQRTEGAAELEKARAAIEEERKLETASQLMGEARASLDGGRNDAAVATLQKLVNLLPSSPEAQRQLETARAKLDPAQAKPEAAPSQNSPRAGIPPDDPDKVRLFEDYIRNQQFKEVEPLVRDYIRVNPKSWWGRYVLGYSLFGQRRIGDSIAELAQSLQLNLNNADAHRLLGRNLMTIGRFDAALTELEQAVKLMPKSAEVRYDLAKIHSANDNYPPAKRELEEAIRLDPSYMEAYEALGFVMEASGDDAAAVSFYEKSAALNEVRGGKFASPYVDLAAYYNRIGNPNLALEYARKALQLNPKTDAGNFQLAKALDRLEQWPEAVDALNHAIESNPSASSYHYVLAAVYRSLGKLKESREQTEIFRKLEKEAAEFEQKRRDARREESR